MKRFIHFILTFCLITASLYAQESQPNSKKSNKIKLIKEIDAPAAVNDKIEFKNGTGNAIITITDEGGDKGSITLSKMSTAPTSTDDKLYNEGGTLKFDGASVSGGASSINELADAKFNGNSLYLGQGAGTADVGPLPTYNAAIGVNTLEKNTFGQLNTAAGESALRYNKIGTGNVGIGYHANQSNEEGSYNTIIGHEAGAAATLHNKSGSVFIGNQAGFNELTDNKLYIENSNSSSPLIWGDFSTEQVKINGDFHVTGSITTDGEFPHGSINDLSDAIFQNQSLFMGGGGTTDDGANYNTAFGDASLNVNIQGYYNSALGYSALSLNTTGHDNTAIGYRALGFNKTGNGNTSIGSRAGPNSNALSNTIAIGIDATTTASDQVRIGNSSITSIGGQVGWTTLSDGRYKRNVQEDVNGLDFIKGLRPVTYTLDVNAIADKLGEDIQIDENGQSFKRQPSSEILSARSERASKRQIGFIAQEVEELSNNLGVNFSGVEIPQNEESMYSLRYSEFVVPLVKAMQEQQAIIEELKNRISVLENNRE